VLVCLKEPSDGDLVQIPSPSAAKQKRFNNNLWDKQRKTFFPRKKIRLLFLADNVGFEKRSLE
jgi:hypothetical protein